MTSKVTTAPLRCQADKFDVPPDVYYLRCAASSPMLRTSKAAAEVALAEKSHPWSGSPSRSFDDIEICRGLFGQLINASAERIAMIPSASYGLAIAARNITISKGSNVLLLEDQFPSNVYVWQEAARAGGARIVTVPRPEGPNWTSAILERVSSNTSVVSIPTCHWLDGTVVDIVEVGNRCRELGAALVIDASQSMGVMPFDAEEVRPDFLVTVSEKWMLGAPQVAFLYVSERYSDGQPLEFNWMNRAGSADYTRLTDYTDAYWSGSRRYDAGGRGPFLTLPIVTQALQQLLDWGPDRVYRYLSAWNAALLSQVEETGWYAARPDYRAGHLLGLRHVNGLPDGVLDHLTEHNVFVSQRKDVLRIAPHMFVSHDDLSKVSEAFSCI